MCKINLSVRSDVLESGSRRVASQCCLDRSVAAGSQEAAPSSAPDAATHLFLWAGSCCCSLPDLSVFCHDGDGSTLLCAAAVTWVSTAPAAPAAKPAPDKNAVCRYPRQHCPSYVVQQQPLFRVTRLAAIVGCLRRFVGPTDSLRHVRQRRSSAACRRLHCCHQMSADRGL